MVKNGIYLLDTNIVSEGAKISPNPKIVEKLDVFADFCKLSTGNKTNSEPERKETRQGDIN